jgi:glycerol-3-phosphate dehydrogenase
VKADAASSTAALSREHTIHIAGSGLLTIAGGKWTTYRRMAADAVDHAATLGRLDERPCISRELRIHGYHEDAGQYGDLAVYGADAPAVLELARAEPALGERLCEALPVIGAQVVWAAREEMARTVEDVLSRRTRALLLDARAARDVAPRVAALLARELGRDEAWQRAQVAAFAKLADAAVI